jgi:hypothetical protein
MSMSDRPDWDVALETARRIYLACRSECVLCQTRREAFARAILEARIEEAARACSLIADLDLDSRLKDLRRQLRKELRGRQLK